MELKSEDKATLKAILDDLETSKIPVDLPKKNVPSSPFLARSCASRRIEPTDQV